MDEVINNAKRKIQYISKYDSADLDKSDRLTMTEAAAILGYILGLENKSK